MDTRTLPIINKLAAERLHLYEQASEHALTTEQRQRINEISDRLPGLWDEYRRELAAQRGPAIQMRGSEWRQKAVAAGWNRDEESRAVETPTRRAA